MSSKLASRKFWICVAAFCGSVATSIAGLAVDNEVIVALGTVCGVVSAACYALAEAMVDKASVESVRTDKTIAVSATSSSKEAVEQLIPVNDIKVGGTDA